MTADPNVPPSATDPGTPDVPPTPPVVDPPATGPVDWEAEAEKWKTFSRKHETASKKAAEELEQLRQSSMTDAEKAVATAKAEGRREAAIESGKQLADAELRAKAATAGVQLPEGLSEYVDMSRFVGADGSVDSDAIGQFVSSFSPQAPKFASPSALGIGRQNQGGGVGQLSREEVSRMSMTEINEAREKGLLDGLLYGGT